MLLLLRRVAMVFAPMEAGFDHHRVKPAALLGITRFD